MTSTRFCMCRCFFTKNLFIRQYTLHVTYENRNQFLKDYSEILKSQGCTEPDSLIPELEAEVSRRKKFHEESWSHRLQIAKEYQPLHPQIYTLQKSFFDPMFLDLVGFAKSQECSVIELLQKMKEKLPFVYTFPVFTKDFCSTLLAELKHFEASPLPKGRINTMNRYGIHMGELGFDAFITSLMKEYVQPLTRHIFPEWGGNSLDSHRAFVVKYEEGNDVDLNYHFDNAEITLNVSLNDDYTDGEVYFGPMRTEQSTNFVGVAHEKGIGILHRAQQKHGAFPISEGVRYNLIIWMRSSAIRNQLCPMCDEAPTMVPIEHGFGDGFTLTEVEACSAS